jgi:hypothetical protein
MLGLDLPKSSLDRSISKYFGHKEEPTIPTKGELLMQRVALLCPTSTVRLVTQSESEPERIAVEANDWRDLSDQSLLSRIKISNVRLHPLIEDGKIIGRLSIGSAAYNPTPAVIFYGSISCGIVVGLSGLVMARENNTDAKRANAVPGGALASWSLWAESLISQPAELTRRAKLRLHPLVPDFDLAVWHLGSAELTLHSLLCKIQDFNKLTVVLEYPTREDHDAVSENDFNDSFEPCNDLISVPVFSNREIVWPSNLNASPSGTKAPSFPWFLNVKRINYNARLQEALVQHWGDTEIEDKDDIVVGSVNDVDIRRSAVIYTRHQIQ